MKALLVLRNKCIVLTRLPRSPPLSQIPGSVLAFEGSDDVAGGEKNYALAGLVLSLLMSAGYIVFQWRNQDDNEVRACAPYGVHTLA